MDSFSPTTAMPNFPLITLTTDFGLRDPFAGVMKGVIAGICPEARVIDLTHEVEAFSVLDGAIKLWSVARYFPAGTIHVAVVDPGVGSERRAILAKVGAQWFIAPDNGLLTWVLDEAAESAQEISVWQIENADYFLPGASQTFHGRDIFAPCAAHLACGVEADWFGRLLAGGADSLVRLDGTQAVRISADVWEGRILLADRFGNLLTNFRVRDFPEGLAGWRLELGSVSVERFADNFAAASSGELFGLFGSAGLLEIAINRGSAAGILAIAVAAPVRLLRKR